MDGLQQVNECSADTVGGMYFTSIQYAYSHIKTV